MATRIFAKGLSKGQRTKCYLGSRLERAEINLTNIFQMGSNHQPVNHYLSQLVFWKIHSVPHKFADFRPRSSAWHALFVVLRQLPRQYTQRMLLQEVRESVSRKIYQHWIYNMQKLEVSVCVCIKQIPSDSVVFYRW